MVRSIYNGLKQIAETVFAQSDSSFEKACLIEYPRPGVWALCFVSTAAKGELSNHKIGDGERILSVFLPTTNSTSGYLLYITRKDVIYRHDGRGGGEAADHFGRPGLSGAATRARGPATKGGWRRRLTLRRRIAQSRRRMLPVGHRPACFPCHRQKINCDQTAYRQVSGYIQVVSKTLRGQS